ncbi:hypothetical protein CARUB_v10016065mg [Capsella rubella]|uniref:Transmembrane protein n=1 Tax=Capsella rubella TaxID=81985 RepID=R0HZR8_9BRAS|nr:uncharacterized protein LOC17891455 [Capsella rubella]EOA29563.1 hypothetical protein CARUB_v10016065mg [Capsella rubella]
MKKKKFLKVVFLLVAYLTSIAMAGYHGCNKVAEKATRMSVVGEDSRDEFGNEEEEKKNVNLWSGRKLVSGPTRRGCGH